MDREPKWWPEKAQLGGCYKEPCQRRGRGAIWRGTLSDPFARKKAREVSQHLHRYSRSRQAPVESLITTAKAECDVNDSLRAVRLCIEDTVVGTALQNLHRELLGRESAWQTLRKTGIDISACRRSHRILETMEPPPKYTISYPSLEDQRNEMIYHIVSIVNLFGVLFRAIRT